MINSGKEILKPNIKIGDVFVNTASNLVLKVTSIRISENSIYYIHLEAPLTGEKRVLWLSLLSNKDSRYHKL